MQDRIIKTLTFISVCLWIFPSGSIAGLPVKAALYMLTLTVLLVEILRKNELYFNRPELLLVIVLLPIMIWFCIGIINGYSDSAKTEIKSFVSLLLIVFIAMLYTRCFASTEDIIQLRSVLILTAAFFIGVKLIVEVLYVSGVIDEAACRSFFVEVLNGDVMTMSFNVGGITLCRLGTVNDTIPLVLFSFDIICEKRSAVTRIMMIGAMALYTVIVFSRIVFAQFVLVILVAGVVYKIKNGDLKFAVLLSAALIVVVLIVTNADTLIPDSIKEIVLARFSGSHVADSDSIRGEQIKYLTEGFLNHPIMGSGLGAYIREYQRSGAAAASYEVEYLSFLYQFGILGFGMIIIPIIISFLSASINSTHNYLAKIAILLNLMIWAGKPLFNPQFLSSASGMVIATLIILGCYYENNCSSDSNL